MERFEVSLNAETIIVTPETFTEECDSLVARHGGGVPKVRKLDDCDPVADSKPIAIGAMDTEGAARSAADYALAASAGFALPEPVYARGSRATGMRQHREAFDALPLVSDAMTDLGDRVKREQRQDLNVPASSLRMDDRGRLIVSDARFPMTENCVGPLSQRLRMANAGAFLKSIPADERAFNVNRAAERLNGDSDDLKLRTRLGGNGQRYTWAVTGDGYATVDADRLASAVRRAVTDPTARANVTYDGRRTLIDALYFSDVSPDLAVAGEVFKVGIRVRSADDGTGSVKVDSVVWANLCLNFIILAEEARSEGRFVHRGSSMRLHSRIEDALAAARRRVGGFVSKWGYACADDMRAQVESLAHDTLVDEANAMLCDLIASRNESLVLAPRAMVAMLRKGSVPIPATAENAAGLVRAWAVDQSSARRDPNAITRASLVNAATRWAHEAQPDPWLSDEIERAAGRMLTGRIL